MEFKFLSKKELALLPKTPGIYAFKKGNRFLYIGKALNVQERIKQHPTLLELAGKLGYIQTKSEAEALILEAKLIKKYQPKYNVVWRDDKKYFYVGITQQEFPRLFITHQPQVGNHYGAKIDYIGPFVNGRKLKETLKILRKTFPYRTCQTLPKKPCLWYQLGRCPAPCRLFNWRMEAYDVSNIQGQKATGAMVTFINGKPDKNFYRRFKIKTVKKPNDIAMIKEVLSRRFKHREWPYPHLILIDGGRAQLHAAQKICKKFSSPDYETIHIIALAKKKNELFIKNGEKPILLKNLPREIFNLILQARDEAHRFARKYHHHLRKIDLRASY